MPPPGSAFPLPGRLEASPAWHGAGQRPGLQRLPTEGGPERQPPGGLRGQDAQQSPADQHDAQVCALNHYSVGSGRRDFPADQSTLLRSRIREVLRGQMKE